MCVDGLVGNDSLAQQIERSAASRPGVKRVHADVRSGRVLLEYEHDAAVLRELELSARASTRRTVRLEARNHFHSRTVEEIERTLQSSAHHGILGEEAARRLRAHGANAVEDERPPSALRLLAGQVANLPSALLLGSALVSLLLGDLFDAAAIGVVVALDAGIGFATERKSERLLASWRVAEAGAARVIRGGTSVTVAVAELVPGDLLVLGSGDVVPADARVVEAHRLTVDEAPLTGESEPVTKSVEPAPGDAPLAERRSMVHRGTTVVGGHGRAIVVATGAGTEMAAIQGLAAASHAPEVGLQGRLDALTGRLAWGGMAGAAVSAAAAALWRRPPIEILRDSVALGVAAIPEGLPMTATAALVRAMARMRARGIVVRRLGIAETLGGVTVACADKTGTLTEGRMRVETIWIDGREIAAAAVRGSARTPVAGPIGALLVAAVLNSDLDFHRNHEGALEIAGSSTERALAEAAQSAGYDPKELRARWPRRALTPRAEGVHYVTTDHDLRGGGGLAIVKGAPEQVVPMCRLDDATARAALDENERLAAAGLRVLAVGWRLAADGPWTLLGLVAMRDPLRAGAAEAVRSASRAGIRTVMITGDQRATAEAIARQVGLEGDVIEGAQLAALLEAPDADQRLRRLAGVARVSPADKVTVVEALRKRGEIVAMAGDGINDAPALRAADVGIAVGARSSDMARQTADIVLEHEDLRTILTAVAEGRIVQDNLRRAVRFQVAGNLGEVALVVGASMAGRRLISPLGLLWINLLTDTLPALALAIEPGNPDVLDRPPARPNAPLLEPGDWRRVLRDGLVMAGGAGAAAVIGGPLAAFAAVGAAQFGYAAVCRAQGTPRGRRFGTMIGGSAALHLLAVVASPIRGALQLTGGLPAAAGSFAVAMAAPLYLTWRRHAGHEVVRRGVVPPTHAENTP